MGVKANASLWLLSSTLLFGCGNGGVQKASKAENELKTTEAAPFVAANQIAFTTQHPKFVVVPDLGPLQFTVHKNETDQAILTGQLPAAVAWQPAGKKRYQTIDLSSIKQTGAYILNIGDGIVEHRFTIENQAHLQAHDAALKSYYLNRASIEIDAKYAGEFARPLGHQDNDVLVHASSASSHRPQGTVIRSEKGWYDAGDFGKYVVNSGIATYTMLSAYQNFTEFYQQREIGIPESNNGTADILDEIKWNLDWLYTMQDNDGGVYHKLTTLEWPGIEMPAEDTRARYVIGKSVSATLDFAATMAFASRVYKPILKDAKVTDDWLKAAVRAWEWANRNPTAFYQQPKDVKSGEYGDKTVEDEFSWAAVELYLATKEQRYLADFENRRVELTVPSWQHVSLLPYISLINAEESIPESLSAKARETLLNEAEVYLKQYQASPFKVAMVEEDYVWGSNSFALNKGWVLSKAAEITGREDFHSAAVGAIDYVLGLNPLAFSYVTGFGDNAAKYPHHRASEADTVKLPLPGMLVGGPQPGQQDKCDYLSKNPAESYVDHWCSYASNEVAINWNAPLVYMLAYKNVAKPGEAR